MRREDYEQIDQLAHRLKGAAGNLGATEVQDAALALETLAKIALNTAPSPSELQMCVDELAAALERTRSTIETAGLIPSPDAGTDRLSENPGALPAEECSALAAKLREAADIGDMAALNALAAELLPRGDVYETLSQRITRLAGDFNFDGVVDLANTLEDPDITS